MVSTYKMYKFDPRVTIDQNKFAVNITNQYYNIISQYYNAKNNYFNNEKK
jgi:hypothetical protein